MLNIDSYSQALSPKRELIVGIRIPLTHANGTKINTGVTTLVEDYCTDSLPLMRNSFKQKDQILDIKKEYIDNYDDDNEPYPRYNGLETGKIQIDCGSEIIDFNTYPNKKIFYSSAFFETGLKLLINKESFDKVTDKKTVSKTVLTNNIKNNIKIGLFEKRINVAKILREQGFINYVPYKNARELNNALANGTINAYVDDPVSILEFFYKFIEDNGESQNKFLIYPPELQDYFFDSYNAKLKYVFAFAIDAEDSTFYQNKINEIIKSHTNPLIEKEKLLAEVAKKLYPQPIPYLVLSKIIEFIQFLILFLFAYRTSIGIFLLVVIKFHFDRKSGVKFEPEGFINSIDNMNTRIKSLFGNEK